MAIRFSFSQAGKRHDRDLGWIVRHPTNGAILAYCDEEREADEVIARLACALRIDVPDTSSRSAEIQALAGAAADLRASVPRALRALADARPEGDEALLLWKYAERLADRLGCRAALHDLGRGTTAQAAEALPAALRVIADAACAAGQRLTPEQREVLSRVDWAKRREEYTKTIEVRGALHAVLARLDSDPQTVEEWDAIREALGDCERYAAKCATMRRELYKLREKKLCEKLRDEDSGR